MARTTKADISREVLNYLRQVSTLTGILVRRIIDDATLPYAQKLEQAFHQFARQTGGVCVVPPDETAFRARENHE